MENQLVEWKESWRDEYIKWICGFANAQGGLLIIGRNNAGEVVDVPDAKSLTEEIPNKVRDMLGIMVDVNLLQVSGKNYLEIVVEPYPYPINYKGQYHYRSGSTKQELKGNALNKFVLQKTGKHWDSFSLPGLHVNELEPAAFDLFRKKAARSRRVDEETMNVSNETLLNHLHLNDGELLKRATALLFHPDPEKYITGAYVKIGYFDSDSELIYQDEIHGNLFQQADKTLDLLFTKYLKAKITYEGITRVETFPFPEAALREAVINAIVHKEYSSGIPVQIKVFEHKLIIWNDGLLPLDWTLKDLLTSHPSKPANPDVANAFFRAGMIESWGRGIEKIIHLCVADGLAEPIFNIAFGGLQIEFIARLEPVSNIMEKSEEKSEEKSLAFNLLDIIKHNPKVTTNIMMGNTAHSRRSIEYQLNILKESGIITRIGSRKNGSWQIDELYTSDEKMTEKIEEMTGENTNVSGEMSGENSNLSGQMSVKSIKVSGQILGLLSLKPEITIPEMSESLGISTRTVERNLRSLQKSNKIEHIGPNKGGYWKVKIKQDYKDVDDVLAALAEEPKLLYDALKKIIDSKKK